MKKSIKGRIEKRQVERKKNNEKMRKMLLFDMEK
jgi:hypothetical protein